MEGELAVSTLNTVEHEHRNPDKSAYHEEDNGDSHPQALLYVVDVVPRVADAEVEHHGRDRSCHQFVAEGFPHLGSRPDKGHTAQEPRSSVDPFGASEGKSEESKKSDEYSVGLTKQSGLPGQGVEDGIPELQRKGLHGMPGITCTARSHHRGLLIRPNLSVMF